MAIDFMFGEVKAMDGLIKSGEKTMHRISNNLTTAKNNLKAALGIDQKFIESLLSSKAGTTAFYAGKGVSKAISLINNVIGSLVKTGTTFGADATASALNTQKETSSIIELSNQVKKQGEELDRLLTADDIKTFQSLNLVKTNITTKTNENAFDNWDKKSTTEQFETLKEFKDKIIETVSDKKSTELETLLNNFDEAPLETKKTGIRLQLHDARIEFENGFSKAIKTKYGEKATFDSVLTSTLGKRQGANIKERQTLIEKREDILDRIDNVKSENELEKLVTIYDELGKSDNENSKYEDLASILNDVQTSLSFKLYKLNQFNEANGIKSDQVDKLINKLQEVKDQRDGLNELNPDEQVAVLYGDKLNDFEATLIKDFDNAIKVIKNLDKIENNLKMTIINDMKNFDTS